MKNKLYLIIISSLVLVLFYNQVFFQKSYEVFGSYAFIVSLGITLFLIIVFIVVLLDSRWTLKPVLILLFLVASVSAYFSNQYHTIISEKMIQNTFETDFSEAMGVFSYKLILYFLFLGVLPSYFVLKSDIEYPNFFKNLFFKAKILIIVLVLLVINLFLFSQAYTSFFRAHKELRYRVLPLYPIYSFFYYVNDRYFSKELPFEKVGLDAKLVPSTKKPKLFIFVVGEAARWDHFSLNGYKKKTNPLLEKDKDVISLENLFSCATETAISVPCMFSDLVKKGFNTKRARNRSSLIDVLSTAGVNVAWVDNNSNSKGAANRIKNYVIVKDTCNGECRDLKTLKVAKRFLEQNKTNFIVLHQMGSHGPEYFKRTDDEFKKFKPECPTNQLQRCTKKEISNAYDNSIFYTDYFLNEVKEYLKSLQKDYAVFMWYVSDHGESLGEKGIYLHGLPYFIAPEAQKHPASILWFSDDFGLDRECVKRLSKKRLSHDNIYSSVLGLMDVKTKLYNKDLDIFKECRKN